MISSVEEYVDFCIRWDINLAGGYEDERMENLKETMRRCGYNFFDKKSLVVIGYYVGVANACNLVQSVAVEDDALVLNYKEVLERRWNSGFLSESQFAGSKKGGHRGCA